MTNKQTGLEHVNVGGDADINVSQEIHHEPNKLAEKIGIAVSGGVVNVEKLIIADRLNDLQSEKFTHDQGFYNNLDDREFYGESIFVGREADLDKLHRLLQAQSQQVKELPMVLITGMAGMGKSELAWQYAKLHLDDFTGGVGIVEAAHFGEEIRDFMQPRFCEDRDLRYERTLKAQVAEGWQAWQKFCGAERLALIVIDDVTDYQTQVAPYLPNLPKNLGVRCPFRFVLTSRSQLRNNLTVLEIEELTTDAAVQVLRQWADPDEDDDEDDDQDLQPVIDDPELAASLCDRLGCLPLALILVGSWLSSPDRTLSKAIAALEEHGLASDALKPDRLDTRQKAKLGLQASLSMSWQNLSPDAQQLGRVLSLFEPITLPWELVEAVVEAYPQQSVAPPVRKGWWQRFCDSFGQLVGLLFPFWKKAAIAAPVTFAPIRNLSDGRIALRVRSLLQVVERGRVFRLHRLVHEFLSEQWQDGDRDGWQDAWLRGLSDRADEIPAFASWELVTEWQSLRPHFASAQKFVEDQLKSATNLALVSIYKLQKNNLIAGSCRLNQAPIFEATYRQAQSTHDQAKAALAKGETAAAQSYFGEALKGYQKAIEQARVALPENSMILASYLHTISQVFDKLNKYQDGIITAKEAVKIATTKGSSLTLSDYLHSLARLYRLQGMYVEAEQIFLRAIAIKEDRLGKNHIDVANSVNSLAVVYQSQGKYSEAEPLHLRSLEIRERQLGKENPHVANSINGLAQLYRAQGKYSEAEPLYLRSLEIRERQLGSTHPDVANSLNNLAELYQVQGKYSEAEPLLVRSLSINERQLGSDHPDVANSLNNLAQLYRAQGRYSEAEPLLVRSLSINERQLGSDHPSVASILNNLALFYESQGKYSEVEPLYLRSLSIRERQLGSDHPDVAISLNNLANLYESQGKYSEAKPLYLRSLEIGEQKLGSDHPDVAQSLNNLASLYRVQGKYSEAESLYVRSLSIWERQLGEDHPYVAAGLNNLALLYQLQGKYSEAEPLYKRSLEIGERKLGEDHPDVATSLNNLALLYQLQGKYSEAEPLYKRSLEIRERQLRADHPSVATSLHNLALLYQLQGKYSEAEPLYKRSLKIGELQLGADHPSVATSLFNLAALYYNTKCHPEALQSIQRAIHIYKQKLGTEHPYTQNALRWLQTIRDAM
ncbi:tetratricopeptide repeat protein [Pseudanabaena sp. Chao 1811]|uniref:tetratricopeptide repeat protein n=1 Tax=Pseudanabaena sp. Chao 1811 TaxID=2963092 RepID=UPI0022F3D7D8|nr:tetratricopeptide repeat protein [Pseudanabaena sp. Chao 1811]